MARYRMTRERFGDDGMLEKSIVQTEFGDSSDKPDEEAYTVGSLAATVIGQFVIRTAQTMAYAIVLIDEFSGGVFEDTEPELLSSAKNCVKGWNEFENGRRS